MIFTMSIFLVVVASVCVICLIISAAVYPVRSARSLAELRRRAAESQSAARELARTERHAALVTLFRLVRVCLLVGMISLWVVALGWLGFLVALILALVYPALARTKLAQRLGGGLYTRYEQRIFSVADTLAQVLQLLRDPTTPLGEPRRVLESREDLAELVAASHEVIGESERALITAALAFADRTVAEVMTPRSVIDFIKQTEFLGPLVLDELHALGHSRLPVIAEDIDHVVGILHLRDLLSLDIKRSTTAEKAMESKVYYIRDDHTLEHALAAFLRTRHHLFIVINENRETVGLVTLEDVLEALIGRKIVDEDDIHADLRVVAAQEGRHNNRPAHRTDL